MGTMLYIISINLITNKSKKLLGDVMSKKGAIPVPYLIAIIFAVAIIAILGYMFFKQIGIFSGELTRAECEARKLTYCARWATSGCDPKVLPFGQEWDVYAKGCTNNYNIVAKTPEDCPTCRVT